MEAIAATTFAPPTRAAIDTTDHDLVAAVRRGDDRAFERLYERYHRRIAAYIYGMVGDYGRAEDIAQDVFLSALRRMRQTDRPIAFKPWIYEIAKNACIDQFRRSRRAEEVSYDGEEGLGAADYGRLVTTGPSPDAAVDQKLSIDHLRGAFGGLSETHHQILVMRELEGLSYREIGERLGMSRPSVESTLFRARRRLSEEYEDLVSGERCVRVQAIIGAAVEGALGARDQRKLAKHVAHCQACRRQARLAGLEAGVLTQVPARARIAAFLPLPAFLRQRVAGDDTVLDRSGAAIGQHAPTFAQWTAQLSANVDPAVAGWAKAAMAAATIAVAGVGVGAGGVGGEDRVPLRSSLPAGAFPEELRVERSARAVAGRVAPAAVPASPVAPGADRAGTQGPAGTSGTDREGARASGPSREGRPATSQPAVPSVRDLPVPSLPAADPTEQANGRRPNSGSTGLVGGIRETLGQETADAPAAEAPAQEPAPAPPALEVPAVPSVPTDAVTDEAESLVDDATGALGGVLP